MATVLDGALHLDQISDGLKSTSDAVFLAAACPVQSDQTVLDMGCGVGTVGLCVKHRVPGMTLTGIDIQDDHIALAQSNANKNHIPATFAVLDALTSQIDTFYDHVVTNPPYIAERDGTAAPSSAKAKAKHFAQLDAWIGAAHRHLKARGVMSMIHRADHLSAIIAAMHPRFGDIEIIPLHSKAGQLAKRIIVRGIRDSRGPTLLHPAIILHNADGSFTTHAESVLRGGQALL